MDRCHSLGKNLNLSAPKLCNGDLPLSYLRHCAEYVVIIINSVVFLASNSSSEKLLQLQCGHNIKQSDTVTGGWEVTTTDTTCWLAAHRDEHLRLIKASRSLEGQEREPWTKITCSHPGFTIGGPLCHLRGKQKKNQSHHCLYYPCLPRQSPFVHASVHIHTFSNLNHCTIIIITRTYPFADNKHFKLHVPFS